MPSSGYIADSFVAGEQPTTSKWNELWGNDASFNSGAGLNDGAITTRTLAESAVTPEKVTLDLLAAFITNRQGGSATNFSTTGGTNYALSGLPLKIQFGVATTIGLTTTVTFPVAFTEPPFVLVSPHGGGGVYSAFYTNSESTTGFAYVCQTSGNLPSMNWIAIGT